METEEIISSAFFKAFIVKYYEDKIYTYYNDKDRLLYALCDTDIEKEKVTLVQIEKIKEKIKSLGNEDLSFSYILSGRSESHEFIADSNKRHQFWLNNFYKTYIDNIITLQPIYTNFKLFQESSTYQEYGAIKFWEMYPEELKPKATNISDILLSENDLISEIEYIIDEYKKEGEWDFDIESFRTYIKTSKPIEDLFNICELFVQLNRLEMFKGFIEPMPDQQTESGTNKPKINLKKYGFNDLKMVKELSDRAKKELTNYIISASLPIKIAYLDYIGFIKHIDNNYTKSKKETHILISKIIKTNERAVRGNINGLLNEKSLDRVRYTAYLHQEKIKEHYTNLK